MGKEVKTNAMRILDKNKVDYTIHLYESNGFMDGKAVAAKLSQPFYSTFKTLVAQGKKGGYYVFVIPVNEELDLKKGAKAVNEKAVEMIPVREISKVTGYVRGGVSPIGMKKAYMTIIHKTAADYERIVFSGGRLGTQIEMNPGDLQKVISCTFEDIVKEERDVQL